MADMDIKSLSCAAELSLEDIQDILSASKGKSRADAHLSDEEYAFRVQSREMWECLADVENYKYTQSLSAALAPDAPRAQAAAAAELAKRHGRRAADIRELLLRSEALMLPTPATHMDIGQSNSNMHSDRPAAAQQDQKIVGIGSNDEHDKRIVTPYKWQAWKLCLEEAGLYEEYKDVVEGIRKGFNIGFPPIHQSQYPPNGPSIEEFRDHFDDIVANEITKERYMGPFTKTKLERTIGPCQSSPLTIIPKPHRPGKYRVIQNFSFPHVTSAKFPNESVNAASLASDFPCTWGTFQVTCLFISNLPPGSQAAVRDVAEAYRTVPLHPSQWPAAVVRAGSDAFYIDTAAAFGARSSGAVFGRLADCEGDIFRAHGIGPLIKWVDDNLFLRVLRTELDAYNAKRREWQRVVDSQGRHESGGRTWFGNGIEPDGSGFEAVENFRFHVRDLSATSPRSADDAKYSYSFHDIDNISEKLGIPWEKSKDTPFASTATYIGLFWNLADKTVSLPTEKCEKYLANIFEWGENADHSLEEVQQIYGRLMHAALAVPSGRARLVHFEDLLGDLAGDSDKRVQASDGIADDLSWWRERLERSSLARNIPGMVDVIECRAFSDASSEVGIGIIIGDWWRAWRLLPDWKVHGGGSRDIAWAEAIGFELLVDAILRLVPHGLHVKLYGDNTGVVQGWWNGRSRNHEVNEVFKCIHDKLEAAGVWGTIHTAYVPSAENPADGLSRGVYINHDLSKLLPVIPVPIRATGLIIDALEPLTLDELEARKHFGSPKPSDKIRGDAAALRSASNDMGLPNYSTFLPESAGRYRLI